MATKKKSKKENRPNIKVSTTRINTFLQCKLKYKYSYIDKYPRVSPPAFKLGTAVHEALEYAGNIWMGKEHFTDEDIENILAYYNKVSVREGIEDQSVHKEGRDMVKRRLDYFSAGEKIIELEKVFGMKGEPEIITNRGVPLIGAIDKVAEYDSDTLIIVDYKTLATAPTSSEIKDDIQLSLYDLVANILYPNYKRIILSLDLLRFDPIYTYRTKEEREEFEKYLKVVYDQMCEFDPSVDAKPTLNQFCAWCDFRNYCEVYREACQKSNYRFLELNNANEETLFKEWEHIKNLERIISNRKKEISNVVINRIRKKGTTLSNEDGEELYIRQNSRIDYDVGSIYNTIPSKDFVNLVSLKKSALDKYVNENPVFKESVDKAGSVNFNKPFIDKRKGSNGSNNSKKNKKNKK